MINYGSGRPVNATVSGDPNQDGNDLNDRLPGYSRNAFTGPDYATADMRLTRDLRFGNGASSILSPNPLTFQPGQSARRHHFEWDGRNCEHVRAEFRYGQHRAVSRLLRIAVEFYEAECCLCSQTGATVVEVHLLRVM